MIRMSALRSLVLPNPIILFVGPGDGNVHTNALFFEVTPFIYILFDLDIDSFNLFHFQGQVAKIVNVV